MTDMIERVARAIWDDACPGMEWGDIDRITYRGWAEAAIKAMDQWRFEAAGISAPVSSPGERGNE